MRNTRNIKSLFYRSICLFWENLGRKSFFASKSDYYNLQKTSCPVDNWRREKNFKSVIIFNKYKDTLDDLIDSSDLISLLGLISTKFYNMSKFKSGSTSFPKKNCFNENVLASDTSSERVLKTRDFWLYQRHDIAPSGPKNEIS